MGTASASTGVAPRVNYPPVERRVRRAISRRAKEPRVEPMLREALFAKIHRATVTLCNPDYMGSITIDQDLLDATGMRVNEKVLIADIDSMNRFETYVFRGARGSGVIGVNGAAARLTGVGHRVIIMSFCHLSLEEMQSHRPKVVICSPENRVAESLAYDPD
jgi:aspartate 1-decarboxylase